MRLDHIIDDQSDPGAYADKFKDAPWYETQQRAWEADQARRQPWRDYDPRFGVSYAKVARDMDALLGTPARCYRDRKAHDKLIATTNEIRAKHGMEPL